MTPESVGWTKTNLVMGKHSGRAAFRDKLRALGYGEIGDNALNDAFRRFKDVADRKKIVYDDDIVALVDDEVMRGHDRIKFVALDVHSGSRGARARGAVAGNRWRGGACRGPGRWPGGRDVQCDPRSVRPRCAAGAVLRRPPSPKARHAQARTTVRLEEGGKMVDGSGLRYRYDRGFGPRLCACAEQAHGQARPHRTGPRFQLSRAAEKRQAMVLTWPALSAERLVLPGDARRRQAGDHRVDHRLDQCVGRCRHPFA